MFATGYILTITSVKGEQITIKFTGDKVPYTTWWGMPWIMVNGEWYVINKCDQVAIPVLVN